MGLSQEEITVRSSIWEAMSILWLDNEVMDYDFNYLAEKMIESELKLEDLEQILIREVAPICYQNLYNVAGVWDGFDEKWLSQEILKNIEKQERNTFYRWYIDCPITKYLMTNMIWKDWEKAKSFYIDKKNYEK